MSRVKQPTVSFTVTVPASLGNVLNAVLSGGFYPSESRSSIVAEAIDDWLDSEGIYKTLGGSPLYLSQQREHREKQVEMARELIANNK